MKKVLFACVAVAIAVALTPRASADPTLVFNQLGSPYALNSSDPADQGSNVSVVNAYITNDSSGKMAITGIEYYLGGSFVSGAYGDTPSAFTSAANGWTYSLGVGNYSNSTNAAWSKNSAPTSGDAVKPRPDSESLDDYLSAVALENSSSSGYCYIDEILASNASCDVELLVTPDYGGANGSSSDTFLYGYAEGVEGTGTFNTGTETWSGTNNAVAGGMQEQIDIDPTPEPSSLVLLGTGFGLLGLGVFLRRRHSTAQPTVA